ncbi:hypothetical protein EIN_058980 [Entamoeba invadens IP1]|uniref:hypothetical protein n=1 Tax=Entamoeba invadens IP1 TaxID=370355 RepID=UPI0002C3E581|nr:hypothetical protein EIN_058980 [Entamoeba invadens IP1]ELP93433.1 hypothetical protein EIN_058980 [Entamoeba invadens IP1]|eukprot:XP_004260204.1 hypothetical protein EIN_058980 [Entamoeba invadens IP1]
MLKNIFFFSSSGNTNKTTKVEMKTHNIKATVQVTVTRVENKIESGGSVKVIWERGDNNGSTKVISLNSEIQETFSFLSTFQHTKNGLKEKVMKITLSARNTNVGSTTINLSDFFEQAGDSQKIIETTKAVSQNNTKSNYLIHLKIAFVSSSSAQSLQSPPLAEQTIRKDGKKELKTTKSSSVITNRKAIEVKHRRGANTSLDTSDLPQLVQPPQLNKLSMSTVSPSTAAPVSSPQPFNESALTRKQMSMMRMRRSTADCSQIKSNLETSKRKSIKQSGDVLKPEEEQLIADMKKYTSFLEMEEKAKTSENTILAQMVYSSLPLDVFTMSNGLPPIVSNELYGFVVADIVPIKSCFYLYSTLSRLIVLYDSLAKKQRNDFLFLFVNELQRSLMACHGRLMELIRARMVKAVEECFRLNCNERPIIKELMSILMMARDCRLSTPFKSILLNDSFVLFNSCMGEEVVNGHCTMITGVQIQVLVGMVGELEVKWKNDLPEKDNLVVLKEIGRVLMLSQKILLSTEARLDVCPHLTDDLLINILKDVLKKQNDQEVSQTISLIERNKGQIRVEFYEFGLPELRENRLRDVVKEAVGYPWNVYDLTGTPLEGKPYLKKLV